MTQLLQTSVFATETSNMLGSCQLGITYEYKETPFAGVQFDIYQVGEVTSDSKMNLVGKYEKYPVELNNLTNDEFQNACNTLYDYIQLEQLIPEYTMTTDENGSAFLNGLPEALYLVAGQSHQEGESTYVTNPQFVTLPYAGNTFVTLQPKASVEEPEKEPITVKVLKKWLDEGYENHRPNALKVHLLKDGEVYETVTLTQENNWRYTWENLDGAGNWSVVEEVPENYTVVVQQEGITFVVSNTYVEPSPTPTPEVTPSVTPTVTPTPTPEEPPKIPQTGLLWWPVPVLAVIGVVLIALGCICRRKDHDEA